MWNKFQTDKPAYYTWLISMASKQAEASDANPAERELLLRCIVDWAQKALDAIEESKRA